MCAMSIALFAGELGLPVELLLEQMNAAGIVRQNETDPISEQDKAQLLEHLRSARGRAKAKANITVTPLRTAKIRKAGSASRPHSIHAKTRETSTATRLACNRTPARMLLTARLTRTATGPVLPVKMLSMVNVYDMFYINLDCRDEAESFIKRAPHATLRELQVFLTQYFEHKLEIPENHKHLWGYQGFAPAKRALYEDAAENYYIKLGNKWRAVFPIDRCGTMIGALNGLAAPISGYFCLDNFRSARRHTF